MILKNMIPPFLKRYKRNGLLMLPEINNSLYYLYKYLKYSALLNRNDRVKSLAFIVREYHAIEKGLSLPNPRPFFGQERIEKLIIEIQFYLKNYELNDYIIAAIVTCSKYVEYNKNFNIDSSDNPKYEVISKRIEDLVKLVQTTKYNDYGGIRIIAKKEILNSQIIDFREFVNSRYSIRDYTDDPVDINEIFNAVSISLKTPSVCNRQGWKAHVYTNKIQIDRILELQNGNDGFRNKIKTLILVTGTLNTFFQKEGHQVFIDGGMFAMSLIYSLHSLGIATCCLNNCFSVKEHKEVREVAKLKEFEVPIMMISVGNLKDVTYVAISKRKSIEDVLEYHP
jgi:nitroreductase